MGITWLPSDNQACHGLIDYQVKVFVLRTWKIDESQILNILSVYL